ncbi:MAG: hypothetical protein NTZ68_01075 [Candidatus Dependentiae bacterium]|nr:hypothetical protein [Candidatus Dependentiae bacterium]
MSIFEKTCKSLLVLLSIGLFLFLVEEYENGDKYIVKPQYVYMNGYRRKISDGIKKSQLELTPEQKLGLIQMAIANNDAATNETLLKAVKDELSKTATENSKSVDKVIE